MIDIQERPFDIAERISKLRPVIGCVIGKCDEIAEERVPVRRDVNHCTKINQALQFIGVEGRDTRPRGSVNR